MDPQADQNLNVNEGPANNENETENGNGSHPEGPEDLVNNTGVLNSDILSAYAINMMITYLTDVWKLSFTLAAGIINMLEGIAATMPIAFAFLADTRLRKGRTFVLSNVAYTAGLVLLYSSTIIDLSNRAGSCSHSQQDCVGHLEKILFFIALLLIATGIAGLIFILGSVFGEHLTRESVKSNRLFFLPHVVGGLLITYISSWPIRFGLPAFVSLMTTICTLFVGCSIEEDEPQGSPIVNVFRVLVAFFWKRFLQLPEDSAELHGGRDRGPQTLPHTKGLSWLDKAAIILPNLSLEEQIQDRWTLCTVTEVEETKIFIRLIPLWMNSNICGLVTSIGNTYFIEQANNLNPMVGKLKVSFLILPLVYHGMRALLSGLSSTVARYSPPTGIALAMLFSTLCSEIAAEVEAKRLKVVSTHDLLDKPSEAIPMSIFWLVPQFVLLAFLDAFFAKSVQHYFRGQIPPSTRRYLIFFTNGVSGIGMMSGVFSVYAMGKLSQLGGRPNWFQYSLNESRLDNYYRFLALLSFINMFLYILVVNVFPFKYGELGAQVTEPHEFDSTEMLDLEARAAPL